MKLISLNVWGGRAYGELVKFLEREKSNTDIFCFQEVLDYGRGEPGPDAKEAKARHQPKGWHETSDLYKKLTVILCDFNPFLSEPYSSGMERLAAFVRKGITASEETLKIHKPFQVDVNGKPYYVGSLLQHVRVEIGDKSYDVANVHGLWQGSGKGDTPERLDQSREIVGLLSGFGSSKILCGDFNLLPGTQSIRIIEGVMRNLIREKGITNTRSSLYTKPLRYADYVFTSTNINVTKFEVMHDVVSDHLPLLLEFD